MTTAPRLPEEKDPVKEVLKNDKPTNDIITNNGHEKEMTKKRWTNRRRMAWLSLIAMFVITYFILFTDAVEIERLKVLKEVITWFYFACISVVGAYMGFTTWSSKK